MKDYGARRIAAAGERGQVAFRSRNTRARAGVPPGVTMIRPLVLFDVLLCPLIDWFDLLFNGEDS